jgi:hypothetical protein
MVTGLRIRIRARTTFVVLSLTTLAFGVFATASCGSDETPPPSNNAACTGDCTCVGDTCTCQAGGTCVFGAGTSSATVDGGGGDGGGGGTSTAPSNVNIKCESKNTCNTTCTTNCDTSCAGQSTCNVEAGTNSTIGCQGGSTCNVTLGEGSTAQCGGNSTCTIKCPKGGCPISCQGSAGCTLECGGTVKCTIDCGGNKTEDCAAGTTCTGCKGGATDGGKDK